MSEKCLECGATATWMRCTQFAGNHPYCDEHARLESDFNDSDSYLYWDNILAGAEQQEDDTQEYREIPCTTINDPNDQPYLSVIADGNLMKLRLHKYDDIMDRGVYFTFDKRALSDLIQALEKYEDY